MSQSKTSRYLRPLPLLVAAILLTLTILACGFIGSGGQSASGQIILTRLPTLTRTPLPTLTPTPYAAAVAAAQATPPLAPQQTENGAETLSPSPITVNEANVTTVINGEGVTADQSAGAPGEQPIENGSSTAVAEETVNSVDASTATPTQPLPTDTPTQPPPTATETPLPTDTPIPTATPTPQDWVFSAVHLSSSPDGEDLLLFGNLTNNTGIIQEIISVKGIFYNTQDQMVASTGSADASWPGFVVAPNQSMPFVLTINDVNEAAHFDLNVEAQPSNEDVRQEFDFSDLNQRNKDDNYCLAGEIRNQNNELEQYLIVALVLYDDQDRVINFDNYGKFGYLGLERDDTAAFEICVGPPNQPVARYELQAWGL